jgi:hypothetical protein
MRNITFVQNHHIQVNGRCSVACLRESLMLEARGSSTLFSILNSVCCLREYCLHFSVFMGEEHHLCTKSHHRSESKKHCSLVRESLMLEAKAFSYLFTIVKSACSLKEYCLPLSVFMGEEHQLWPNTPFQVNRETL